MIDLDKLTDEQKTYLIEIGNAFENGLREQLKIDPSWRYIEIDWINKKYIDVVLEFLNKENSSIVSLTVRGDNARLTLFFDPIISDKIVAKLISFHGNR